MPVIRSTASALCKASGSQCHETFLEAVQHWSADEIDRLRLQADVQKTPVHLAAWKGCFDNLRYLVEELRCDINVISTARYSFGKTPIFFALTQSREEIVLYLLERGAHVKIINNKGQSPLSIASSHLSSAAVTAVRAAESAQADLAWQNYRLTHSDGLEYGDLDPRFFFMDGQQQPRPTDHVTEFAINPTTRAIRHGIFRRNNPAAVPVLKDKPPRSPKQQQQQQQKHQRPSQETGLTEQESEALAEAWSRLETVLGAATSLGVSTATLDLFSEAIVQIMHLNVKQRREWLPDTAKRLRDLITPAQTDFLLGLVQATSQKQNNDQTKPVALLNRLASHLVDPDRRLAIRPPPMATSSHLGMLHETTTVVAQSTLSMDESPWSDAFSIVHHLRIDNLYPKGGDNNVAFLPLRKAPVWIDSIDALNDLKSSRLIDASLISIDTEWASDDILSTLQIAIDDDAWVVDLLKKESKYQLECKAFIRYLFGATRFILGFAIAHDLRKLEAFVGQPLLPGTIAGDTGGATEAVILDVQKLFVLARSGDLPGLAGCVAQLVSATTSRLPCLSKALQCSAWDQRPLKDDQIEYAALDAVILGYIVSEKGRRCNSADIRVVDDTTTIRELGLVEQVGYGHC